MLHLFGGGPPPTTRSQRSVASPAEDRERAERIHGREAEEHGAVAQRLHRRECPDRCDDAERLTREEEITTTVHYLRFSFTPEQQAAFADGPVVLGIDHPAYRAAVELGPETRASLAGDFA